MKYLQKFLLIMCVAVLFYLNASLYYKPQFLMQENQVINKDVYNQLQFLKASLLNGSGEDMQSLFPEGFVFIYALYGLSWYELIDNLETESTLYNEGVEQIRYAFEQINSAQGKSTFDKNLPLKYGAFYKGWSNYLLGKLLEVQARKTRLQKEVDLFLSTCNEISEALKISNTSHLESYAGQVWPADVLMCIASLNVHDKIFTKNYEPEISQWLNEVKERLDANGLIPHKADASSGYPLQNAKGNSQSLMLNFLFEIDREFAQQQFKIYETLFKESRFGLPGIRQYPKDVTGSGDIDSGPVILGIGGAASIVGQRVYALQKDWITYEGLRNSIESFGVGLTINSKKRYIFGQLPMADAFICWSNSIEKSGDQVKVDANWRIRFHLISLFILLIISFLLKSGSLIKFRK